MTGILNRSTRIAARVGISLVVAQAVVFAQVGQKAIDPRGPAEKAVEKGAVEGPAPAAKAVGVVLPALKIDRVVGVQKVAVGAFPALPPAAPAPSRVVTPPPVPSATGPTLYLPSGGFASGELLDSPDPASIRWSAPAFAGPIDFGTKRIDSIRWPIPSKPPEIQGEYRFELAGGGLLSGSLVSLDDSTAELDIPGIGRLHVDRSSLHRLHRRSEGTDLVYSGPNGLVGWRQEGPKNAWREESGQPFTDQPGAALRADLNLPPRMVVEFEVSWKAKPDFLLAIGTGAGEAGLKHAFRFEVFDGELVVGREVDTAAEIASLGPLADKPGRAHLLAYIDQAIGRILVVAPDGRPLADLSVINPGGKPDAPPPRAPNAGLFDALTSMLPRSEGGVALVNVKGDVRLENIQVGKWDGQAPRLVEAGRSRVHLVDGSISYGQVVRLDSQAKEFVLKVDGDAESRIAVDRITDVYLSSPDLASPRPLVALQADGGRIGGSLRKVEGGAVEVAVPGVREPLRLPFDRLRSLTFQVETPGLEGPGRPGVLEAEGLKLPGKMADSTPGLAPNALVWRPSGGQPAPIRAGIAGRIVYAEPKPPVVAQPVPQPQNQAPRAVIAFNNLVNGMNSAPAKKGADGGRRSLHLRTGDVIPCEVIAIEEAGVRIKSDVVPGSIIPHEKIKAIELAALASDSIKVGKEKRERILTLPRMQKGSPPTQLIRSTNGDYLRGRVVAMDEFNLQVEVRLDTKSVPRDRIARIIWFHADELGAPKEAPATPDAKLAAPAADAASPVRVQAVRADGVRLTFHPEAQADGILSGTSDVLGACRVKLADVDLLLIGPAIERTASQLAYGRWVLHDAEEPKFAKADGTGGGSPGSESEMVGKPAPDFSLDMLDGKKFHLAENKGQVVILDFWATWCGPCIQAMPQVERVAKEFADRGVKLVAVNLQESPKEIKAMLERQKLDVAVALDRDGVVAERYAANAIPQTVIIDRAGGVARLFVGGGPDFDVRLREALIATLGEAEKR